MNWLDNCNSITCYRYQLPYQLNRIVKRIEAYGSEAPIFKWKSKQCYYSSKGQDDQDDSGDFGVALRNLSRHRMTIADTAESFIRLTLLIGGTWCAYSSRTGRCKLDKRNDWGIRFHLVLQTYLLRCITGT